MALLHGSSYIYATSNVEAIDAVTKAKMGKPQAIKSFFKIDGKNITAHNRTFRMNSSIVSNDIRLASGNKRRYYLRTPERYALSFTYLPGPAGMTADGDAGRDYLYSKAMLKNNVLIEYLPDYTASQDNFDYKSTMGRIVSYSETLLRRNEAGGCYYYDVSIELEGL